MLMFTVCFAYCMVFLMFCTVVCILVSTKSSGDKAKGAPASEEKKSLTENAEP